MRLLAASAVLCLTALSAQAANPKVESATKVFHSVANDSAKVKTFCEMSKAMDAAGDKPDAATDAKIQTYMTQLGPDFQQAWDAGSELEENSEEGKTYNAALDSLASKCS
jgi:hypothetical protein